MTYPLSQPVQPGDATLASQYNNLRNDALFFGADSSTASPLRDLFARYHSMLSFQFAGKILTLIASAEIPCGVMIDGVPKSIVSPTHAEVDSILFAGKKMGWIFAVAGSDARFTLALRPSAVETVGSRLIGKVILDPATLQIQRVEAGVFPPTDSVNIATCDGRLTLAAGTPFPSADIPPTGTLYFTPCHDNGITLYDSVESWQVFRFQQLAVPLAGLSAESCYDAFISAGADHQLTLSLESWGSLTARGQALRWQDGVLVLEADARKRYVGTIGLSETGKSRDTLADRNVWNLHHPVARPLRRVCSVVQNTNHLPNVWIPYARDANLNVSAVIGQNFGEMTLYGMGCLTNAAANASILGIGIDINENDPSLTLNSAEQSAMTYKPGAMTAMLQNRAPNRMLGKHRYHLITYTQNDTHTFGGTVSAQNLCGLAGSVIG